MPRKHVKSKNFVWCDHHGVIHPDVPDYYGEGTDAVHCHRVNWRTVWVSGESGEEF